MPLIHHGPLFQLIDTASGIAMLALALALLLEARLWGRPEPGYAAMAVALLASFDVLDLHAHLAGGLASLLPTQTIAGQSIGRILKIGILAQTAGCAFVFFLLACRGRTRRTLLAWLCGLIVAGGVAELGGSVWSSAAMLLSWAEELAEFAVNVAASASLTGSIVALALAQRREARAMGIKW